MNFNLKMSLPQAATGSYLFATAFLRALNTQRKDGAPMTSVLSPVLSENTHNPAAGLDLREASPLPKQDTREYLADMLRELSAIAAWAELDHAREHIDAALREIEGKSDKR
jgi:hypothetical protein